MPEELKDPKIEKKKSLTPDNDGKKTTYDSNVTTSAKIVVSVPAAAKLYFNNVATRSTSNRREFESPELIPGMLYEYTVKAELVVDGKTEVKTETVEVRAGQVARLHFAFPTTMAAK